jgi:hypothetical protein
MSMVTEVDVIEALLDDEYEDIEYEMSRNGNEYYTGTNQHGVEYEFKAEDIDDEMKVVSGRYADTKDWHYMFTLEASGEMYI